MIPVPLAHLVGSHADLGSNLHLLSIGPVGVALEGIVQDSHLGGFFPHSSTHLPLAHVVLLEHESHLGHVRASCLAGLLCPTSRALTRIVALEGEVADVHWFSALFEGPLHLHLCLLIHLAGASLDATLLQKVFG